MTGAAKEQRAWCTGSAALHLKVIYWLSADKLLLIGCCGCLRSCFTCRQAFHYWHQACRHSTSSFFYSSCIILVF